jgi:hypothetical protein
MIKQGSSCVVGGSRGKSLSCMWLGIDADFLLFGEDTVFPAQSGYKTVTRSSHPLPRLASNNRQLALHCRTSKSRFRPCVAMQEMQDRERAIEVTRGSGCWPCGNLPRSTGVIKTKSKKGRPPPRTLTCTHLFQHRASSYTTFHQIEFAIGSHSQTCVVCSLTSSMITFVVDRGGESLRTMV